MKSEIKYIPIKQLKAWGKNPRKNDKAAEKLVKLIEAHGFINPVICTRDNTIRAGHTRVKAANKAGLKEVPVIYVDMDEEQASAFAIADNKSSEYSEWDFELLKDVFEELDAFNYDLELTGFDMAEIEGLMTYAGKEDGQDILEDDTWYIEKRNPLNIITANYDSNNSLGYPNIYSDDLEIIELLPYDKINTKSPKPDDYSKTVHFFLNDYKFEALWNNPKQYINLLQKYNGILMPDFSNYSDYPLSLNIFQMYRRFWLTRFFQENLIKVIPVPRINDLKNYENDLKPIPKNSMIALSSVRMLSKAQQDAKLEFIEEVKIILDYIEPKKVYWYGNLIPEIDLTGVNIQRFKQTCEEVFKNG
jgi:hypothetical protein